jgi:hypothetical protein
VARIPQDGARKLLIIGLALAGCLSVSFAQAARPVEHTPNPRHEPLVDGPVLWYEADDAPIPQPEFYEPGIIPTAFNANVSGPFSRFFHPGRVIRWLGGGDRARTAADVNALDEVPNSTWFTNRLGLHGISDEELRGGPATGTPLVDGPDRSQPWLIIGAKTAGVTPGFRIKDGRGDIWLLKFDPPQNPDMSIRSGAVSALLFHALGYNVPVDRVVTFDREELRVQPGTTMKLMRGTEVALTEANLDSILTATNSVFPDGYQGLASRYLDGAPLGPFDNQGVREDDPNDRINHQDRRSLRAVRLFGAWINHFDTKMHNSLDMYVGEEGRGHVKHHFIDFASTLGTFGDEPVPRFGYEFGFDIPAIFGRVLTLGLVEDAWVRVTLQEGLKEVGMFVTDPFEPHKWKPDWPNTMMSNLTDRDGYWAAKILSAFSDEQLRLVVEQGKYQDPRSVDYLVRTLAARRDIIARHYFGRVPPLDYFLVTDGGIVFSDLAVERGYARAGERRYRYRLAAVDARRRADGWTEWQETTETRVPLANAPALDRERPFLAVECQLWRDGGWSSSTTVYQGRQSGRIVALDR